MYGPLWRGITSITAAVHWPELLGIVFDPVQAAIQRHPPFEEYAQKVGTVTEYRDAKPCLQQLRYHAINPIDTEWQTTLPQFTTTKWSLISQNSIVQVKCLPQVGTGT